MVFEETDIKYLTFYGFSLYNFDREETEKHPLFYKMADISKKIEEWVPEGVGIMTVGDLSEFEQYELPDSGGAKPSNLKALFESTKRPSESGKYLTLLIGYDGVDEIEKAADRLLDAQARGEQVSGKNLWDHTYTSELPPADLMIRTGNEERISGFVPYLISYSELHFDKKMWPAFGKKRLKRILKQYSRRNRRLGK